MRKKDQKESGIVDLGNGQYKLIVPKGDKMIPGGAYIDFLGLVEVFIPGTIKAIGESAFKGCQNLRKVHIEEGVFEIGEHAFDGTGIEELRVPSSVQKIGIGAFCWCINLKKAEVHSLEISNSMFRYCSNLVEIKMCNVRKVGDYAFSGVAKLKSIFFPDSTEEVALNFSGALDSLVPPSIQKISLPERAVGSLMGRIVPPKFILEIEKRHSNGKVSVATIKGDDRQPMVLGRSGVTIKWHW